MVGKWMLCCGCEFNDATRDGSSTAVAGVLHLALGKLKQLRNELFSVVRVGHTLCLTKSLEVSGGQQVELVRVTAGERTLGEEA